MRGKPKPATGSDPKSGHAVSEATRSRRIHDPRGKFVPGNGLGGRPKGAKDRLFSRNGVGSLRKVYDDFINCRGATRRC
jgi:hypothetical protein